MEGPLLEREVFGIALRVFGTLSLQVLSCLLASHSEKLISCCELGVVGAGEVQVLFGDVVLGDFVSDALLVLITLQLGPVGLLSGLGIGLGEGLHSV